MVVAGKCQKLLKASQFDVVCVCLFTGNKTCNQFACFGGFLLPTNMSTHFIFFSRLKITSRKPEVVNFYQYKEFCGLQWSNPSIGSHSHMLQIVCFYFFQMSFISFLLANALIKQHNKSCSCFLWIMKTRFLWDFIRASSLTSELAWRNTLLTQRRGQSRIQSRCPPTHAAN